MEASLRIVNIKNIAGEVRSIAVARNIPVSEFKIKVSDTFRVPVNKQRLICQGKLLKDEHLISEYVKEDGVTVHLLIRADSHENFQRRPMESSQEMQMDANAPIEDQMLAAMIQEMLTGTQVLGRHVILQPVSNIFQGNRHLRTQDSDSSESILLPIEHIHNIGMIVNELSGNTSGLSQALIPQLPFPRNDLTSLGIYLFNFQSQLSKLLLFISRVSDLMERESLLQTPNERSQLQHLSHRVGLALSELALASSGISPLLQHILIGQAPGQFTLPSIHAMPAQPPPAGPSQPLMSNLPRLDLACDWLCQQLRINPSTQIFSFFPSVISESLPLLDLFYSLTISDFFKVLNGDWHPVSLQIPKVKQSLLLQIGSGRNSRNRIVMRLLDYLIRKYWLPGVYSRELLPGFDASKVIATLKEWVERALRLILDETRPLVGEDVRNIVCRMIGHYIEEIRKRIRGDINAAIELIWKQALGFAASAVTERIAEHIGQLIKDQAFEYFHRAHSSYIDMRKRRANIEDEVKRESAEELLDGWIATIERDCNKPATVQRPFSRSYLESDIFAVETKEVFNIEKVFWKSLEAAFSDVSWQAAPLPAVPVDIFRMYLKYTAELIRGRIHDDQDFRSTRFASLNKISK